MGYGPEFKARIAYWSQYQLIPLERVCEMAEDLYGYRPSEATVLDINCEAAAQVTPVQAIIHARSGNPGTHNPDTPLVSGNPMSDLFVRYS